MGEKQEHVKILVWVATCIQEHFWFLPWQAAAARRTTVIALQARSNLHNGFSILHTNKLAAKTLQGTFRRLPPREMIWLLTVRCPSSPRWSLHPLWTKCTHCDFGGDFMLIAHSPCPPLHAPGCHGEVAGASALQRAPPGSGCPLCPRQNKEPSQNGQADPHHSPF